ncbi:MAG: pilus assembly protein [Alphaproteobacteria bacterium]|nr:pilus assembly protein [Alphaproteobacteria bacterium]
MLHRLFQFLNSYSRNRDGATAIEFALVAIPFLLIIFGVMEGGRLVWSMNAVQYAVEETSRYAALNPDLSTSAFQEYALDRLADMYVPGEALTLSSSTVTSNGIDFVQVDGQYTYATMLGSFLPGDFGDFDFQSSVRKPLVE